MRIALASASGLMFAMLVAASLYAQPPTNLSAPAGRSGWYFNASTTTGTVTASQPKYQRNLSMPKVWNRALAITEIANGLMCNKGAGAVTVSAAIGVSCPSEDAYPMKPYVALSHPVYKSIPIPAGQCMPLHIVRMDSAVQRTSPWGPLTPPIMLAPAPSGCYPKPALVVTLVSGSGPVSVQNDLTATGTPLN